MSRYFLVTLLWVSVIGVSAYAQQQQPQGPCDQFVQKVDQLDQDVGNLPVGAKAACKAYGTATAQINQKLPQIKKDIEQEKLEPNSQDPQKFKTQLEKDGCVKKIDKKISDSCIAGIAGQGVLKKHEEACLSELKAYVESAEKFQAQGKGIATNSGTGNTGQSQSNIMGPSDMDNAVAKLGQSSQGYADAVAPFRGCVQEATAGQTSADRYLQAADVKNLAGSAAQCKKITDKVQTYKNDLLETPRRYCVGMKSSMEKLAEQQRRNAEALARRQGTDADPKPSSGGGSPQSGGQPQQGGDKKQGGEQASAPKPQEEKKDDSAEKAKLAAAQEAQTALEKELEEKAKKAEEALAKLTDCVKTTQILGGVNAEGKPEDKGGSSNCEAEKAAVEVANADVKLAGKKLEAQKQAVQDAQVTSAAAASAGGQPLVSTSLGDGTVGAKRDLASNGGKDKNGNYITGGVGFDASGSPLSSGSPGEAPKAGEPGAVKGQNVVAEGESENAEQMVFEKVCSNGICGTQKVKLADACARTPTEQNSRGTKQVCVGRKKRSKELMNSAKNFGSETK